jgi:hypothetical protein
VAGMTVIELFMMACLCDSGRYPSTRHRVLVGMNLCTHTNNPEDLMVQGPLYEYEPPPLSENNIYLGSVPNRSMAKRRVSWLQTRP